MRKYLLINCVLFALMAMAPAAYAKECKGHPITITEENWSGCAAITYLPYGWHAPQRCRNTYEIDKDLSPQSAAQCHWVNGGCHDYKSKTPMHLNHCTLPAIADNSTSSID